MSRLTAKPCRKCLKVPVVTLDEAEHSCSIKCTHCNIETYATDNSALFDFNKSMVMDEAIRLWNDKFGIF